MKTKYEVTVTTIKTGHEMFASLHNSSIEERRQFVNFYRSFKENGVNKYKVKINSKCEHFNTIRDNTHDRFGGKCLDCDQYFSNI